jgi:hypothetical protein
MKILKAAEGRKEERKEIYSLFQKKKNILFLVLNENKSIVQLLKTSAFELG